VLFDLDGTLLDTLQDLADSCNTALAAKGFPVHPVDAYRQFIGDGFEMLMMRVLPREHRDFQTIQLMIQEYRDAYSRNWNVRTCLFPGMV